MKFVILAFLILCLAACAAQAAPAPTATSLPPTLAVPSATRAPTSTGQSTPATAGAAKDCGPVALLGPNPPRDPSARTSEDCFRQAFDSCSPATLTVSMRGVDAGTTHQFQITKNGAGCRITDTVSTYVIPMRTPAPTTVDCTSLEADNGGLLVKGCGEQGDISIPAPNP